jgi:hypothetical protein
MSAMAWSGGNESGAGEATAPPPPPVERHVEETPAATGVRDDAAETDGGGRPGSAPAAGVSVGAPQPGGGFTTAGTGGARAVGFGAFVAGAGAGGRAGRGTVGVKWTETVVPAGKAGLTSKLQASTRARARRLVVCVCACVCVCVCASVRVCAHERNVAGEHARESA